MGLPACQPLHAWYCDGPRGAADRRQAPPRLRRGDARRGALYLCGLILGGLCLITPASAETLRIATFNTELGRDGPGLLLRDILRGDRQAEAVAAIIAHIEPDVIALQGIDYDHSGAALGALVDLIEGKGANYPHRFALRPNSGMATGLDMDRDGRLGRHGDKQSFGAFAGSEGMAVLSRLPIHRDGVQDLSGLLWQDLPDARLPTLDGAPFLSPEVLGVQRLSSIAHWVLPVALPSGHVFHLLTWHASPPVFDGPEDRNGLRNADELRLWSAVLDGRIGTAPTGPFVLAGDANLDPFDGDGRSAEMQSFLARPDILDPIPTSAGAPPATADHTGPPERATTDWRGIDVGTLRVDYVLPSDHWTVIGAGVFWPAPDDPLAMMLGEDGLLAGRHRLVWVDLEVPDSLR